MKVILRIHKLMQSEIKELPDCDEFNIARKVDISPISVNNDITMPTPMRLLSFRNTGEIAFYTAYREPVYIFELR